MASFDDALYCVYADMVGASKKVQNYADVIHGWSLSKTKQTCLKKVGIAQFNDMGWNRFWSRSIITFLSIVIVHVCTIKMWCNLLKTMK